MKALPFGAISHLWQLPTSQSALIDKMSGRRMGAIDEHPRARFLAESGQSVHREEEGGR